VRVQGDVVVGDLAGVLGDLIDQRSQRLGKPRVVERGMVLGVRRPAFASKNPRDQRLAIRALTRFLGTKFEKHYFKFSYSALACFSRGMLGSASFQSVRKS